MNGTDRAVLRTLAEAASPGPWSKMRGRRGEGVRSSEGLIVCTLHSRREREDMRFIAAANPTAVLDLLDAIARVEAVCGDVETAARTAARGDGAYGVPVMSLVAAEVCAAAVLRLVTEALEPPS